MNPQKFFKFGQNTEGGVYLNQYVWDFKDCKDLDS